MAKQTITLGTAPTGVGGDTPRSAFTKSQANFDETYAALGVNIAAASVYGKANALGICSQSGGIPTGAIMEYGAVTAGSWHKFLNGVMICRGEFTGYTGGVLKTVPMPAAFIDNSIGLSIAIIPTTGYEGAATYWASSAVVNFYSNNTRASNTVIWVAIGRWY